MKKIVLGLLAAALMSIGLVHASTGVAAAKTCPQYTGCVPVRVNANQVTEFVNKGERPKVRVRVAALSGNAQPSGTVQIVCERPGATVRSAHFPYAHTGNGVTAYFGPRLFARRSYTCRVLFRTEATFYNGTSNLFRVRVI